jgi:hypothetical protein
MSYKNNVKRKASGRCVVYVSSKTDAFCDGLGTVLDIFPEPRPRTIRAFVKCHSSRPHSVSEAILGDWAAIARDMWAAIEKHAPEKSEEAARRSKTLTAR